MRQRTINWNGAMRDMRRHRSPEQMLIREMLDALKGLASCVGKLPPTTDPQLLGAYRQALKVITKAEARNV